MTRPAHLTSWRPSWAWTRQTLVGGIDDATGIVTGASFREQEDAAGDLEVLTQKALHDGLPVSLYSDRHGIF